MSGQTHYCGLIRILIFKGFVYTVFSVLSSVATTPDALGLPHDPHLTIWTVFVLVLTFDLLAAPIRNTVTHWNKVITVCLNSDRSESNDTPNTTPATLTLHRGLLSHAAVWLQWSAHATTGDEQKQAKGTAEHRVELVLPTDHDHHHTRANIHIHTLSKWCSCQFHHTELKICRHSSAAPWPKKTHLIWLSSAASAWRAFQVLRSGNLCEANTGEWRTGQLQAVDPPVCTQSMNPPWKLISAKVNKIVCSWVTHTMYNAQCEAAETNAYLNTPFPTGSLWPYILGLR